MRQYYTFKEKYDDAILFFRMGDFYETFGDDAIVTSEVLDITLTSRGRTEGRDIPLAGIPYHALDAYLHKMVKAGYKVAICEQVENPKKAKGIVKRDVVRLVSPGTVVEDSMLSGKGNNFLASISGTPDKCGLSVVDISTGDFLTTQIEEDTPARLKNELDRFQPSECIVSPRFGAENVREILGEEQGCPVTELDATYFDERGANSRLQILFGVKSLAGFGVEGRGLAVSAAGAAVKYLENMQMCDPGQITNLRAYSTSDFMVLDTTTMRNLEIFKNIRDRSEKYTLIELLDRGRTPMGSRLIRSWVAQPLQNIGAINERLDGVEHFMKNRLLRSELRECLNAVRDMERLISRTVHGSGNARDMLALKDSLAVVPVIKSLFAAHGADRPVHPSRGWGRDGAGTGGLENARSDGAASKGQGRYPTGKLPAIINASVNELDGLRSLVAEIESAIAEKPPLSLKDGGLFKPGYNAELDEIREMASSGEKWIAGMEEAEREATGIKSLKIKYNKVFGYFLEVTRTHLDKVPEHYIRKQTLSNAERFITPELKEKEAQILSANERLEALEYQLFCELREKVAGHSLAIQRTARAVGKLDALAGFAELAELNRYCRPVLDDGKELTIIEGRHPVVEAMGEDRFIPNDTRMDMKKSRVIILTGPNMAGKSTYMRQQALIALMAHIGCFVPAKSARLGLIDRIFTRVGAYDDLTHGQSTFMVEMTEVANILNNASSSSLILLDEIGRGTSTFDGLSIAWAVAEYIQSRKVGAKTIFATHYHHLTELEELQDGVANYNIAVKEHKDDIIFLRKVIPGSTNRSYGVQVARLAGLPPDVISRAKEILRRLEEEALMEVEKPADARGRKKRGGKRRTYTQLVIFDQMTPDNPVLEELRALDPNHMTPMEALHKLQELKEKLDDDGG